MSSRDIISAALKDGPKTMNEMCEAVGGERKKVVQSINDCINARLVERYSIDGEPGYHLTKEGMDRAKKISSAAVRAAPQPAVGENTGSVASDIPSTEGDAVQDRPGSSSDVRPSDARGVENVLMNVLMADVDRLRRELDSSNQVIGTLRGELANAKALADKLQGIMDRQKHELEAMRQQLRTEKADSMDILDAAWGYLVRAPKRKPRTVMKIAAAVGLAKAAAANGSGYGDVFALVPVAEFYRKREIKLYATAAKKGKG